MDRIGDNRLIVVLLVVFLSLIGALVLVGKSTDLFDPLIADITSNKSVETESYCGASGKEAADIEQEIEAISSSSSSGKPLAGSGPRKQTPSPAEETSLASSDVDESIAAKDKLVRLIKIVNDEFNGTQNELARRKLIAFLHLNASSNNTKLHPPTVQSVASSNGTSTQKFQQQQQQIFSPANRTSSLEELSNATDDKIANRSIVFAKSMFKLIRLDPLKKSMGFSVATKPRGDSVTVWHILINDTNILVVQSINTYYYWFYAQTVSSFVIFCAIVVGNASILLRLKSRRRRRSNVNYFIIQLAIADLLVGVVSISVDSLLRLQKAFPYGLLACRATKFIEGLFLYSSTNLLVALSIDRWEAVVKPLAFTRDRSRGNQLVFGSWLLAVLCALPVTVFMRIRVIDGLPQCYLDLCDFGWRVYMVYLTSLLLALPALIIAICYAHIVYTIWSKGRQVAKAQRDRLARVAGDDYAGNGDDNYAAARQRRRRRRRRWAAKSGPEALEDASSCAVPVVVAAAAAVATSTPATTTDASDGTLRRPKRVQLNSSQKQANKSKRDDGRHCKQSIGSDDHVELLAGLARRRQDCNAAAGSSERNNDDDDDGANETEEEDRCSSLQRRQVSLADGHAAQVGSTADLIQRPPDAAIGPSGAGSSRRSSEVRSSERADEDEDDEDDVDDKRTSDTWQNGSGGAEVEQVNGKQIGPLEQIVVVGHEIDSESSAGAGDNNNNSSNSNNQKQNRSGDFVRRFCRQVQAIIGRTLRLHSASTTTTTTTPKLTCQPPGGSQTSTSRPEDTAKPSGAQRSEQHPCKRLRCAATTTNSNNNRHYFMTSTSTGSGNYTFERATAAAAAATVSSRGSATSTTTLAPPSTTMMMMMMHPPSSQQTTSCSVAPVHLALAMSATLAPSASNQMPSVHQHGSGVIPKARIKTIKMTLVIVVAYILCWSPFCILNLLSVFGLINNDSEVSHALMTLTSSLSHLNSAVNPIIFWLFSNKKRRKSKTNTSNVPPPPPQQPQIAKQQQLQAQHSHQVLEPEVNAPP